MTCPRSLRGFRAGVEPKTLRLKVHDSANAPPRPIIYILSFLRGHILYLYVSICLFLVTWASACAVVCAALNRKLNTRLDFPDVFCSQSTDGWHPELFYKLCKHLPSQCVSMVIFWSVARNRRTRHPLHASNCVTKRIFLRRRNNIMEEDFEQFSFIRR